MRPTYFRTLDGHALRSCIADVSVGPARVGYLHRIHTTPLARRHGLAREVLTELLADADAEGIKLVLEINPYGDMTFDQLAAWYERNGFVRTGPNWFERSPAR